MSVSVTPQMSLAPTETLDARVDGADAPTVKHDQFDWNPNSKFDGSSTPAVDEASFVNHALSTGSLTIDLASLTTVESASKDMTGKKLEMMIVHNPSGNSAITIAEGATNGYALWGTGNGPVEIPSGGRMMFFFNGALPDIDASNKTIDLSGTGSEELSIGMIFG